MAERNWIMESRNQAPWEAGPLGMTADGRYFCCGGKPFFLLGDTAWLLFHQLTLEESYVYLRNRRDLGYNVILADFIHTADQKNLAGDTALVDGDPAKPNTEGSFWTHVDAVVEMARELGLFMGLLPVWGSSVVKGGCLNPDNVDAYMKFVLERYHDCPHIIWIVGGDVRGDVAPEVFRRMGRLMKADRPDRLVTFHPFGRTSSSLWFHEEEWLDFNLFQSGHRRYDQVSMQEWDDNTAKEGWFGEDNWKYVERDLKMQPARPVLDGEPSYEWILQGLHDNTQPYWKAADVRRYAYWSVLAGAAGHVYGHNSIMQFYRDASQEGAFGARYLWTEAIHHPGGAQMVHLKRLCERVGFEKGHPAREYLLHGQGEKYDHVSVFAGEDFLLAYTVNGREIPLSLGDYADRRLAAYWMDPVTGLYTYSGEVSGTGEAVFTPPEREDGTDSVLVLLAEEKRF
ncbi:MAG: glycoside hydrolase family 140 protein [Acetatifactor sp.]|nr:glycoside hydrolase family 140 protein [Acetatifactor sp.]